MSPRRASQRKSAGPPPPPVEVPPPVPAPVPSSPRETTPPAPSLTRRAARFLFGGPKSLSDRSLFHRLTLIPFLAWVGLGADGLSSSSYGPDEAFRTVGHHTFLLVGLAVLTALTVVIIASAYSRIIEDFPHGGGGYVVATKLLGPRLGVVSGSALLVDYVLTIAVSVASAGDALFSSVPLHYHVWKLPAEVAAILFLTTLNIRGVKESVLALMPIFIVFLLTHVVAIVGGLVVQVPQVPAVAREVSTQFKAAAASPAAGGLGVFGMLMLFLHAYSMGGGTYTGIEAVSNGLPILREPRVPNGKRTMLYMAVSLAATAGGLLICYLLWRVTSLPGKTMNAVLLERLAHGLPGGTVFVIVTLISEGALLVVAAQAGFIDGPRVLGNMAVDSWMPRRFAALSERLTTQNGVLLMGAAALVVLLYERGDVRRLVVMYSINVFLTFSLSMFAMARQTLRTRRTRERWKGRASVFIAGLALCVTVLTITTIVKFREGGWLTVSVTVGLIGLCFLIKRHYTTVGAKLQALFAALGDIVNTPAAPPPGDVDARRPTAVLLVAGYGGLGIHTLLNIFRAFPGHFKNLVIVSVGVLGAGEFKGEDAVATLRQQTEETLRKYVDLARRLGIAATSRYAIGTDAVDEAERLCLQVAQEFPQVTFFAGKIIFSRERWYQRLLHNETALAIEKRLQWAGHTMTILPARVR
jgi:amino acid transporter